MPAGGELVLDKVEETRTSTFLERRVAPAMRTCRSVEDRLSNLSEKLARAATLLRTKVDVAVERQNRDLLHSMNKRAKLQLRLQQTVEGLSVVAISYYAVSLLAYLVEPVAYKLHLDKTWAKAALVLPVVLIVWLFGRAVKKRLIHK